MYSLLFACFMLVHAYKLVANKQRPTCGNCDDIVAADDMC